MSENKPTIYMGSYSAEEWIKKILTKEIELPPYQRDFEWSEENGFLFADSLINKYYIPPVTLGLYEDKTYLIDGQQRLTTLLCLKYRIWSKSNQQIVNDDEERDDDTPEFFSKNFNFTLFQESYDKETRHLDLNKIDHRPLIESTIEKIQSINFNEIFLSYSCIYWHKDADPNIQKRFFSETFTRINTGGQKLSGKEVRKALYWIYPEIERALYQSDFESSIKITSNKGIQDLDYAGYLSIVFTAYKDTGTALKYSTRSNSEKFEKYVTTFISFITRDNINNTQGWWRWNDTTKNYVTTENYQNFQIFFNDFFEISTTESYTFSNIYEADLYLFGIIYYIYKGKSIDISDKEGIKNKINQKVSEKSRDSTYSKNPNALIRIRHRLDESIQLWEEFIIDTTSVSEDNNAQ